MVNKKLNGKAKWITIGLGSAALLFTIALTIGGCWTAMNGRLQAVESGQKVQTTKHESLKEAVKEGFEIAREERREQSKKLDEIRNLLMQGE